MSPMTAPRKMTLGRQERTQRKSNFTRAAKRVIAPFVKITRRSEKSIEEEKENEQFTFYLEKKPIVLLRDLSAFLSDSVDLPSVLHETAEVLKSVTRATAVTLYIVDSASNQIYVSQKKATDERFRVTWTIRQGTIIAAFAALTKEYIMLDDILGDKRFPEGIGFLNQSVKSVLTVPVVTPVGDCFAVIELYKSVGELSFNADDLRIVLIVAGWMGAAIHQNQQRLALQKQQELNDYLLDLTKCYFADTALMEKMITEIVKFAKATLGAERGSFFIIDKESGEMVADMFDDGEIESGGHKRGTKIKFSKERGIAGLVARTGITINVKDAYTDPRFNKDIDQKTGYITRSILCMPIVGPDGIMGVVQVINKNNGGSFNTTDENLFKTFSVYCALALRYTQVHTQMTRTIYQTRIYGKLFRSQIRPCIHDLRQLQSHPTMEGPADFNTFAWYISVALKPQMPQLCLHMYNSLDPNFYQMDTLIEFVLQVRKGYRDNPYHNFEHAFTFLHTVYTILIRNLDKFSLLERRALMIGGLCHDIDHPGYTNNFIQMTKDELSLLYEDSYLENHHFYVTCMVLESSQLLSHIDPEESRLIIEEMRADILATDLRLHFRVRSNILKLIQTGSFSWADDEHKRLIKDIIMTSADMGGQCKPFLIAQQIAESLLQEFYHQGDIEKCMNMMPLSIMDRNKQFMVPEDQIQFLSVVVIPCVDLMQSAIPNTVSMYKLACNVRKTWQEIIEMRGQKIWRKDESFVRK